MVLTAAKLANNSITLNKISIAGATAGEALIYNGTGLVWQKVHVSQIDGLLGGTYASVFPDALDNTALIEIDGIPTFEAIVTTGPGLETQRIQGFQGSTPFDVPGPSMEWPFVFEYSGPRSNDLQTLHGEHLATARTRPMT